MSERIGEAGRFITLEGIDGAGKSSHIDAIADWLKARGHTVRVTREPGGTALAEALREMVLHQTMDALTETLLVFAARRDHLVAQINPALARDKHIVRVPGEHEVNRLKDRQPDQYGLITQERVG